MRTPIALVTTALVATLLAVVPGAPTLATPVPAVERLCLGQPVTIVGTPDRALDGTGGDDVILTNGARDIRGRAGADLLCVTGPRTGDITIDAGPGDDRVVVQSRAGADMLVELGEGADLFRGGSGDDEVLSGEPGEDDDISTGPGDDRVSVAGSGRVAGGPDRDSVQVATADGDVTVDLPAGTVTSAGRALRLDDVETVSTGSREGTTTVIGTPGDDAVGVFGRVSTRLGAGADSLSLALPYEASPFEVAGGPGRDRLSMSDGYDPDTEVPLAIDALEGLATSPTGVRVDFSGFETYRGDAPRLDITGTDADDDLSAFGCEVTLRGGGGDDDLELVQGPVVDAWGCYPEDYLVYGNAGDDVMLGTAKPDLLVGGGGRDVADGRGGYDECRAEVRRSCER
ncbi:calcium-binding protein [Nocardioides marinquilinus]|uniref:Calcium-binding protein n=1 Tax=Nocardioides marinquilinus TaxID=1210400 RepID=A0ABP9P7E1_9ACTN